MRKESFPDKVFETIDENAGGVDEVMEPPELLGPMLRGQICDDVLGCDIGCGVEVRRVLWRSSQSARRKG